MIRRGGRVVSVPVHHRPRERGVSKYGVWNRLWVGIVDLFGVMWLQQRANLPQIESPE
jgi:dolichol-phosphate mannosyltransferase